MNERKELDELQEQLALMLPKQLLVRLKSGEIDAATFNVIRQYLKDNGVQIRKEANRDLLNLAEGAEAFPFPDVKTG